MGGVTIFGRMADDDLLWGYREITIEEHFNSRSNRINRIFLCSKKIPINVEDFIRLNLIPLIGEVGFQSVRGLWHSVK